MLGYPRRAVSLPARDDLYLHALPLPDGSVLELAGRRGRPTLVVNTASQSGFAEQFRGLQELQERHAARGLLVIGCPSSDFGGDELEDPAEIDRFVRGRFGVEFPLTAPLRVRFDPHPFWRDLAAQPEAAPPLWSFNKYLIGPDGRARGWWATNVRPHNLRIREAVEAALADQTAEAANTGAIV